MNIASGKGGYFNEDGTSTINEPGSVKGLQMLADLYKNGYAPKDSVNWGFNEIVAGFYSGTCAMLDQDPDALIGIAEKMKPEDFAVAPMPDGPDGKSFPTIGYAGWAMFADCEHKDEAWKLMAALLSPEGNLEWAKIVGVLPIHNGAEQDAVVQDRAVQGLVRRDSTTATNSSSSPRRPIWRTSATSSTRSRSRTSRKCCSASARPRTSPTNGPPS